MSSNRIADILKPCINWRNRLHAHIATEILAEKEPYHYLACIVEYGADHFKGSRLKRKADCERFHQIYRQEIEHQLRRTNVVGVRHENDILLDEPRDRVHVVYRVVCLGLYREILSASGLDPR